MTPLRWLHATVLLAGRAADLTQADLDQMLSEGKTQAQRHRAPDGHPRPRDLPLRRHRAPHVPGERPGPDLRSCPGRHPRGHRSPGITSTPGPSWVPHVTLCYSTSQQPAAPVIAALGKTLPAARSRSTSSASSSSTDRHCPGTGVPPGVSIWAAIRGSNQRVRAVNERNPCPGAADLCEQTAKIAEAAGAVSNDKVQRRLLAHRDHQTLMITLESANTCRQVEHRETVQDPFGGLPSIP